MFDVLHLSHWCYISLFIEAITVLITLLYNILKAQKGQIILTSDNIQLLLVSTTPGIVDI